MATLNMTKDNFEETLNNNDIVFIDFWADWCGPCKMFAPVYEKASEEHTDIVFSKCDTEKEQELAGAFGVQSIPTLAIFRDNILLFKQAGALPESALKDLIKQVKELDMDDVRKQIEEEKQKQEQEQQES
jgi:thioredoxin 1